MKYKIILILLPFIFFLFTYSCTNWKAKYLVTQGDLDDCLSVEPKEIIYIEDETVKDKQAVQTDTLYIRELEIGNREPAPTESQNPKSKIRNPIPELYYDKQFDMGLKKDSVKVWLTVENRLIGNVFVQTVRIDSVKYPKIKVVREYSKVETIREYNRWKMLIWGFMGGLFIFGVFAYFWTRYKR